jgi:two-component system phosphate regulon sensor histidine kinase PhoR
MIWGVTVIGIAFLIAAIWWRHRVDLPMRELVSAVDDLIAGRTPPTFISRGAAPLQRIARSIEDLAGEQKRLRKQITQEGFSLQVILASMAEGVLVVDRSTTIRLANSSLLRLFDLSTSPVGHTILATMREASIHEVARLALESGEPQSREIASGAGRAPGATRYLSLSAVPMKNPKGQIDGAVIIFHDVSRLRQLEEVRKDFVANVSHELRTPLAIFHGYLENLIDNPRLPRKELVEILHILKRHSNRLNALLEDLLSLARLESRTDHLEREPISVAPFLHDVVNNWTHKVAEKNIELVVETQPQLPVLNADALRMEQVLNNLIDNAIKYTGRDGRIVVAAQNGGNRLRLSVRDNGAGITPADLPHIFERFYRAEKGRSREHGGTGLGLSIVKHIAQLHGGAVHAESTFGEGTTITLDLPIE